ncbi:MAG TPA: sigma-70 family RNA polymerase sigma factor [Firmicutes bacterium]|nr:sigma-70 family RNA polymerase sigma factor [Bacillota bacterium]
MDRKRLNRHKSNKRELALLERQLDRLYERLENVETVSGKVTKSGDDFPYIEEHVTVQMAEPKAATAIKDQIRVKEDRQKVLQGEIEQVESFIEALPDGIEKRVMEMVYLDDMTQRDAAEAVGYTQARVSQIIMDIAKDL